MHHHSPGFLVRRSFQISPEFNTHSGTDPSIILGPHYDDGGFSRAMRQREEGAPRALHLDLDLEDSLARNAASKGDTEKRGVELW